MDGRHGRVLMLTFDYPPDHTGGVGTHCASLAEALVTAGIGVTVVAGPFEGPGQLRAVELVRGGDGVVGVQLERATLPERDRWAAHQSMLRMASLVARTAAPTVVHTQDVGTSRAAGAIAAEFRVPQVCTVHTVEAARRLGSPSAYDCGIDELRARMVAAADATICVSEALREDLLASFSAPRNMLSCVYSPIDRDRARATAEHAGRYEPGVRQVVDWAGGRPVVAFVGRLAPEKCPGLFLQIAHETAASLGTGSAAFVLVGDGKCRQRLERLAHERGMDTYVRLVGRMSHAAALGILGRSAALMVTSRYDAAPIVVTEAMALGVPVVGASLPGIVELLGGGAAGLLVPSGAPVSRWIDALRISLTGNREVKERIRAAERLLEQRHSAALVAQQTLDVYRAVIARRLVGG